MVGRTFLSDKRQTEMSVLPACYNLSYFDSAQYDILEYNSLLGVGCDC